MTEMVQYYVKQGDWLLSYGQCQQEVIQHIRIPPGGELVQGELPQEAMAPPPEDSRFNLSTGQWEGPPLHERLWAQARARRDRLLAACDWVVTRAQERGEPVPPQWLAYRQALRDITEQPDPEQIQWPVAPEASHG